MDEIAVRRSIGEVAARLAVPVRTVRFWSDQGLAGDLDRTPGGYRLYDAAAIARLDLVASLRQLGVALPAARALLGRQTSVAELSARERQHLIDDFVERAFADVPPGAPGTNLAASMRALPPDLPEEATSEQVSAWLELAALAQDPGFADRVREVALAGPMATPEQPDAMYVDMGRLVTLGRRVLASGLDPASARAGQVVDEFLDDGRPPVADRRARLAQRLVTFTDARVERYHHLLAILHGQPAREPSVPAVRWITAALNA